VAQDELELLGWFCKQSVLADAGVYKEIDEKNTKSPF
jgi:hypothetical protein